MRYLHAGEKGVLKRHAVGACGCHPTVVNSRESHPTVANSRSLPNCSEQSGRRTKTGLVKTGLVKTGPVKTGPVKTGPVKTGLFCCACLLRCLLRSYTCFLCYFARTNLAFHRAWYSTNRQTSTTEVRVCMKCFTVLCLLCLLCVIMLSVF
jgi:hypothetical protein